MYLNTSLDVQEMDMTSRSLSCQLTEEFIIIFFDETLIYKIVFLPLNWNLTKNLHTLFCCLLIWLARPLTENVTALENLYISFIFAENLWKSLKGY